uniref:MAGUK p55 scaffold protein 4 n=1 Tax=Sparus aurata TaxID=8175 RepID=A0A671Y419_SPAAU
MFLPLTSFLHLLQLLQQLPGCPLHLSGHQLPACILPRVTPNYPENQERPSGATIKRNEITGEIFVARVIHGGLADRSGLLHAGDRIIEVNGFCVDGMEPEQVIQVVAKSQGTIMFKVIPITERPVHNQTMLYVRAMADYSPHQDPTIPCADAGMSFRRGDVLEIVDQTDALWWQAKKLPSNTSCAGLIPSTNLLKRKQREFWWSQPYQPHACIQTCKEKFHVYGKTRVQRDSLGFRRSMRLCRRRSHSTTQPSCHTRCPSSCHSALNSPYEEVVRYQRHPQDAHRPIALLGPPGVGVNELRRRLIEMNPNIFQGAIPHTTRAPKGYEESGREYYFTSREIFDNMMYNNRFLEYGENKGNHYGTSIESVKEVLNSGKICVIDIEPNAIHAVRTHELRAYVIYVKPPPLERLRETRQEAFITTNYYVNRPFKDEDFQEMEESARKIESQYCQFFDHVIVNNELQDSCIQLLTAVTKAQDEPQWVPASWIRPTES